MAVPYISAATGKPVNDGRQSTYGGGLGTVYQYGHALPYGPYTQLAGSGAGGTGGGSSSSSSTTGKTPEATKFLNDVMSGSQLPYSPDRINQLYSQASDQNAAAEGALQGQINATAAAGGASANDPSLQGARLGAMARRQTSNATANRDINEQATGANFNAKMQAAGMLEESRRQSEALAAGVQKTALGYMPWNQSGGGGVNNFNLPQQMQSQSNYDWAQNQVERETLLREAREDAAYNQWSSSGDRTWNR